MQTLRFAVGIDIVVEALTPLVVAPLFRKTVSGQVFCLACGFIIVDEKIESLVRYTFRLVLVIFVI